MKLRIASLVPSVTELLVALGLAPWLVARTGFCVRPREALQDVPKVGGTKDVNLARLRELAPTHVVVNVDENEWPTVQALREFVPQVIVTHPCAPQDNLVLHAQMVEAFGAVPGVRERAAALAQRLQDELERTAAQPWPPKRVLYCIWREPWMTVARDTYISRMLALVGWQTLPDVEGGPQGGGGQVGGEGQHGRAVPVERPPYRVEQGRSRGEQEGVYRTGRHGRKVSASGRGHKHAKRRRPVTAPRRAQRETDRSRRGHVGEEKTSVGRISPLPPGARWRSHACGEGG